MRKTLLSLILCVNVLVLIINAQDTTSKAVENNDSVKSIIKDNSKDFLVFESEVLAEINLARSNPEIYVKALEETKKYFKGNVLAMPNEPAIETNEGVAVVDEAIEFLKQQKADGEVKTNFGLASAAKVHLKDMTDNDISGHKGSDGSMPNDRLAKFGIWNGTIGELIDFGSDSARQVVLKIIIDDGVATRGHRLKLFNPNFKLIGLAVGKDKNDANICVVELAEDFSERKIGFAKQIN